MNKQIDALTPVTQLQGEDFLAKVGSRVRSSRENIGLTRRELSLRSGVSERHLAQLETGKGNISVRLLQQIAVALNTPIEHFVQIHAVDSQSSLILRKIDGLDPQLKSQIANQIDQWLGQQETHQKAGRIALIGLRGAGKSTIGRKTSELLGIPFIELDDEITSTSGMSVADIFSTYGETRYRELERECLNKVLAEHQNFILEVAGGIVSSEESYAKLLQSFHTVWLNAEPEEHMGRVMAQGDRRPVQGNPDAMNNLRALLRSREPQYELAHFRLCTSEKSITDCCEELARLIGSLDGE